MSSAPTVRVLDDAVVNRIAAGEVVERPASVVKELVENALDAGATDVRVELEAGGRRRITVVDDGSGMGRQDALLCLERHATSKIRSDEDLLGVITFGFRGEALPSIAAVSRFELLTRPRGAEEATRVRVEGGRITSVEAAGGPPGTSFTVRDIFFNVPARRAFLRSAETEYGHCLEAVIRAALLRADVDFSVVHNDRETLRAVRGEAPGRRVAALLGPAGEALQPVAFTRGEVEVRGFMSPIGVHRQSASGSQYLHVNGRFVRDALLRRAVAEAWKGLLPIGRHPVVVLDVRVPPGAVDVNVHPSKVEVRFRNAQAVLEAVSAGLRESLRDHGLHRPAPRAPMPVRVEAPAPPPVSQGVLPLRRALGAVPEPQGPQRSPVPFRPLPPGPPSPLPSVGPSPRSESLPAPLPVPVPVPPPVAAEPAPAGALLPVPRFADLRVIGQYAQTYLVCEGAGELVLVDQHAAHERVTLHRLQQQRGRSGTAQVLLQPMVVDLPPARAALLEPHLAWLGRLGLEVEPFGGGSLAVKSVPAVLGNVDPRGLLQDLADELAEEMGSRAIGDVEERMLASLACHTSVRAHQALSAWEMRALLAALDEVDFGVCAHGRPVAIRLGAREIQARFHRD